MKTILIFIASILPHDAHVVRETVDCVERNNYHDGDGRLVFTQYVFWDWTGERHEVAAWRLAKDGFLFHPPVVTWTEENRTRQVRGAYWRETWTQYDVEMVERCEGVKRRELRR